MLILKLSSEPCFLVNAKNWGLTAMTMLREYRKAGGFLQLIQLVETTEPRKRMGLFDLIAKEDPGWANLLRLKILTLDRILNWNSDSLAQLWPEVPLPMIVALWQKSPINKRSKIEGSLNKDFYVEFRRAADTIEEISEAESTASVIRFVTIVRDMAIQGKLRLAEIDPALSMDFSLAEKFEAFSAHNQKVA